MDFLRDQRYQYDGLDTNGIAELDSSPHIFGVIVFKSKRRPCPRVSMFIAISKMARKLRETILLHLGLVTFPFHVWETLHVIVADFWMCPRLPNNYV